MIDPALKLEYRFSKKHGRQFLWPNDDVWAWKWLNKLAHWDLPLQISKFCPKKTLVIQAGGNAGLYPYQYGKLFANVITFEPDPRNYYCLCHNVPDQHVVKYQAAIGNTNEFISLTTNSKWDITNSGALQTVIGGTIPQKTIDSLKVNPDLIHLDIEGFEAFALIGAEHTIKNAKPLVVLETNGSGDAYEWSQEKIDQLLSSWGYIILERWEHDTIYKHANT
jgi:FkbM family methyltransferase